MPKGAALYRAEYSLWVRFLVAGIWLSMIFLVRPPIYHITLFFSEFLDPAFLYARCRSASR